MSPSADAQTPLRYGPNITLEQAKTVMAAAETDARRDNWPSAIAVVDTGGRLVMLHRMDGTQIDSITMRGDMVRIDSTTRAWRTVNA